MSEIMENWVSVVKFRIPSYFAQVTSIVKYFKKYHYKFQQLFIFCEIRESLKTRLAGLLPAVKLAENNPFLTRSYGKTQRRLFTKHKHNINTLELLISQQ